ncbi:hypothetical protein UI24_00095 [Mycobacteroides franklinii]|nr:hypothetical protein [Mycobacteroides franklinii]
MDLDQARQVVQKLKQLGGELMSGGSLPPTGSGPEKTTAAIAAVFAANDRFSKGCGTFLQETGAQLEHAVQVFEEMDEHNSAIISAVDPRNM